MPYEIQILHAGRDVDEKIIQLGKEGFELKFFYNDKAYMQKFIPDTSNSWIPSQPQANETREQYIARIRARRA